MYVFNDNIGEFFADIEMAEIPEAFNSAGIQPFGDLLNRIFRNADYRRYHIVFAAELFKLIGRADRNSADNAADFTAVLVKDTNEIETSVFKNDLIGDSRADIACADENCRVQAANTEYPFDLLAEMGNGITDTLLTEFTEAVEILPHLRGGGVHALSKLVRAYM